MTLEGFGVELSRWLASYPDIHFRWESIKETSPGVVVVEGLSARSTNDGAPLKFGPYQPVGPTGAVTENPPLTATFHFKGDNIAKYAVDSHGKMSGPLWFYVNIGGLVI